MDECMFDYLPLSSILGFTRKSRIQLCIQKYCFCKELYQQFQLHAYESSCHTQVCTMFFLWLRSFKTVLNTSTTPAFVMTCSRMSRAINVPVLPTPALQKNTCSFTPLFTYFHFFFVLQDVSIYQCQFSIIDKVFSTYFLYR